MHTSLLIIPDDTSRSKAALIEAQATDRVLEALIAWPLPWPANGWPLNHHEE
jgi:hypothetical protein